MKLQLTKEQQKEVAFEYIKTIRNDREETAKLLKAIFSCLHFVPWAWSDMLHDVTKFCSKAYHIPVENIVEDWK